MAEVRSVKMTLCLMLLLQVAAITEQLAPIVKEAEDVDLPCENVKDDRRKCDGVTWIYRMSEQAAEAHVVRRGTVGKAEIEPESKSDRLRVTESCSLLVKRVTVEDAGRYTCRRTDESGVKQGADSQVYLSVVAMAERRSGGEATLSCFLSTYKRCEHTVTWLLSGKEELSQSRSLCSANVTLGSSWWTRESLSCEVTRVTGKVERFPFERPSDWWLHAIGPVCFAAFVITVAAVVLVRRKRRKGNKTKRNDAEPDDGVSYVSITYSRKPNNTDKVRGGGDTVTYSAVKHHSSSTEAAADPSNLYAVIN